MFIIYPEQLNAQLSKELRPAYLLLGNNFLLLQESAAAIRQMATARGFDEYHTIQVDNSTDWESIFSICQEMSLFASRKIIMLTLPEHGPDSVINKNLATLVRLLHNDILLMLCGSRLTKTQENSAWFTLLTAQAALINCQMPEQTQLLKWIAVRASQHNLQLDEPASHLLCYYYEGNLTALSQVLKLLSLLWPDGIINLSCIKQVTSDAARFLPFHWIDAILTGKSKRTLHILRQLRLEGSEPIILLRKIQHELLLLITLKRQPTILQRRALFNKQHIRQNRQVIAIKAINRLSYDQLRQAIHLLSQAELALKQDFNQSIWTELESISLLLCHREPTAALYSLKTSL